MPDWLKSITDGAAPNLAEILAKQGLGFVFGFAVAAVYRVTRGNSDRQSRSLMATLVLLTLMIAMIASVIGDNVARAFSLVGALSVVRFRTIVEDTRDTAFVILAVGVGMAVGAGYPLVPVVLIPAAGLAAYAFKGQDSEVHKLTIITSLAVSEQQLENWLEPLCSHAKVLALSTARQGVAFETTFEIIPNAGITLRSIAESLSGKEGVISVDLKVGRDERSR